jgi:pimeloyl-ACP methyl ester carboxylesterase
MVVMIESPEWLDALENVSASETARFVKFLATHTVQIVSVDDASMSYCICGEGAQTILTFAGGLGGIEVLYETILGFEERNRIIVVDISPFDDPDDLCRAVNLILDREDIERVVVMGQSLSGILAQLYFRRQPDRAEGLVLTNTPAPKIERSRKWVMFLFNLLPFVLLKPMIRREFSRLGHVEQELPPDIRNRRLFAQAMLSKILDRSFTRERIGRILKLVQRFNEEGGYGVDEFNTWPGRVLLISSEDDPYHEDAVILSSTLPSVELFTLPRGFGHTAPQIHWEEFRSVVQNFLDRLAS